MGYWVHVLLHHIDNMCNVLMEFDKKHIPFDTVLVELF